MLQRYTLFVDLVESWERPTALRTLLIVSCELSKPSPLWTIVAGDIWVMKSVNEPRGVYIYIYYLLLNGMLFQLSQPLYRRDLVEKILLTPI